MRDRRPIINDQPFVNQSRLAHRNAQLNGWGNWQVNSREFSWKWDQWFWWNGWGWNKRALIGFVPFVDRAWRPDIAPSTIRHFQYHLLRWSTTRGVRPNQVFVNMNSGSVAFTGPPS